MEHNSGNEGAERFACDPDGLPSLRILVYEAKASAEKGEQRLVFCKTRKETMDIARQIAKVVGTKPASGALEALGHLDDSHGKDLLVELFEHCVAYHNSDLDWDQRDVIERWFRQGDIAVLCATSTLAMGINLPAKNVFIDPNRWDHRTGRAVGCRRRSSRPNTRI